MDAIQFDTYVLDQLIESNHQSAVLDELRQRAEQSKDQVDDAVYRRVIDDYTTRLQALQAAAEPLRARARSEFDKLQAACARLIGEQERARLEKEELEFRHRIGELEPELMKARLEAPLKTLDECRSGLADLHAHKAQFFKAFGNEESLLGLTTRRVTPGEAEPSAARGRVHVETGGGETIEYALGAVARIGRAEDNDICVQSRGMSRHHAEIVATLSGFTLRDLGSQNGTVVNGERVAERPLADGDQIALGDARIRFSLASPAPAPASGC